MLYLILISVWPFINYYQANSHKINNYREILFILLILLSLSVLSSILSKKLFKVPPERLFLSAFAGVTFFFGYGTVVDTIGPHKMFNIMKLSYVYFIVFIGIAYFLWRISSNSNVQKVSKILVSVVFTASVINLISPIISDYYRQSQPDSKSAKLVSGYSDGMETLTYNFHHKPNVYYILVDAYARQDTLKEVSDFDNEPFLRQLEDNDFIVSKMAQSNYHFTVASLSATMNMAYHQKSNLDLFSYPDMQKSLRGFNRVREIFRQNGYSIVNIPAHWQEVGCYGNEDVCKRGNNFEIYESFLSNTPLRTLKFPNDYVSFDLLKDMPTSSDGKPKFVFAHIAQIHDAVFDESGNFHSAMHPCFSGKHDSVRYVSSIRVINRKIMEFIDYIKEKDPQSVVIIQADHGPTYVGCQIPSDPNYWLKRTDALRLKDKNEFRYTFGIFSAIRLPKYDEKLYEKNKQYFSGFYSLVNTFRYVFAYLSDQRPILLPDRAIFLYYDESVKAYKEDSIDHLAN